jgi:hypothetical protein
MRVRKIIRGGGFEPKDVKLLDAVFAATWRQLECYYPAEGTERDAARERLASIVVTLGKTCRLWMVNRKGELSVRSIQGGPIWRAVRYGSRLQLGPFSELFSQ